MDFESLIVGFCLGLILTIAVFSVNEAVKSKNMRKNGYLMHKSTEEYEMRLYPKMYFKQKVVEGEE